MVVYSTTSQAYRLFDITEHNDFNSADQHLQENKDLVDNE